MMSIKRPPARAALPKRRLTKRARRIVFASAIAVALAGIVPFTRHSARATTPESALRLNADLSARKLYVRVGDSVAVEYDVAVGKEEKPTPRGAFVIKKIVWNPAWVPPDEKWAQGKAP